LAARSESSLLRSAPAPRSIRRVLTATPSLNVFGPQRQGRAAACDQRQPRVGAFL
jgi:hypothetical protein